MTTAVALLVHGLVYALGAWLAWPTSHDTQAWALWYCIGAMTLVLALHVAKIRVKPSSALQVLLFAALLAVWFWGANFALDALGNSVQASRTPLQLRSGLPIHFILLPGVASVALAVLASTLVGRRTAVAKPTQLAGK